jgi:hypothetical protein
MLGPPVQEILLRWGQGSMHNACAWNWSMNEDNEGHSFLPEPGLADHHLQPDGELLLTRSAASMTVMHTCLVPPRLDE